MLRLVSNLGSLLVLTSHYRCIKLEVLATSLVAQWERLYLPMHGFDP